MSILANLIFLDDLFSVTDILKSHGFEVSIVGQSNQLIISNMGLPKNSLREVHSNIRNDYEIVYNVFDNKEYRNELLNYILKGKKVNSQLVESIINHRSFQNDRNAYSTTFEWYIGELMVREFAAMSSQFGVTISNLNRNSDQSGNVGDFDVISILRNLGIAYFECKTGKFNRNKILKAIERSIALHCEFVIFFVDDKIIERNLTQSLRDAKHPLALTNSLDKVSIKNSSIEIFKWMNCYFITTENDVKEQINITLRINSAMKVVDKYATEWSIDTYNKLGYNYEVLLNNNC